MAHTVIKPPTTSMYPFRSQRTTTTTTTIVSHPTVGVQQKFLPKLLMHRGAERRAGFRRLGCEQAQLRRNVYPSRATFTAASQGGRNS